MADNTVLPVGVGGDTIADEDIAGVKYQKIKLVDPTAASTAGIGVAANPLRVDPTGSTTQPVSAASLPLPTGAATGAKQDTGNTSVASIDTKIPALGQALAASSVPVVLTVAQLNTLTPPAAITGFALESGGNLATIAAKDFATQTTLALIKAKTDNLDAALSTRAVESGGNLATLVTRQPALGAAVTASSSPVNIASDQTVNVAVASLPLPSGAATEAGNLAGIAASSVQIRDLLEMQRMQVALLQAISLQLALMAGTGPVSAQEFLNEGLIN